MIKHGASCLKIALPAVARRRLVNWKLKIDDMALPPNTKPGARVAVLGGGNGTSRVLRALLPLLKEGKIASLHALVQMADDGGSTGRLRAQYEVGAMGDLSRCLMSVSGLRGDVRGEKFLTALEHRFSSGDFSGHTLRNAMLAALEITSDLDAAIATFARVLQVPKYAGVVPTTLEPVTQQVEVEKNGQAALLGEGEHFIAHNVNLQLDPAWQPGDVRVTFAEKDVPLNPRARRVLEAATHIVVAPGHTYGSILPALASLNLDGSVALQGSRATIVVLMTLLTTPQHTVGWSGEDFVRVYESYLGRPVDVVVANTGRVPTDLVSGQDWVAFQETDHSYRLLAESLVSTEIPAAVEGDGVPRAIVIHDEEKIRQLLSELVQS